MRFRTPLLLAVAAAACGRNPSGHARPHLAYSHPSGLFSCRVPSSWKPSKVGGTETKNATFLLETYSGEASKEVVVYSFGAFYYAPDSAEFGSADEYLRLHRIPYPERRLGPVTEIDTKAGPARRWDMSGPSVGGPESRVEARTASTFVLVPAKKGFFVLNYSSPEPLHDKHLDDFKLFVESFSPGRNL